MREKGEGTGGEGGGNWGRELGEKGEGTGNGVPPVHPLHIHSEVDSDFKLQLRL